MSYDVRFCAKVEGVDYYARIGCLDANITYNVGQLIRESSGWNIKNGVHEKVKELVPKIRHGLNELLFNTEKYIHLESPDRWGTIKSVIEFYRGIISSYLDLLEENHELLAVAMVEVY